MRLKIFIWLYAFLTTANLSLAQENDLPENLNGKIKMIISRAYSPKIENGRIIPGNQEYSVEYNYNKFFDENKNLKSQLNIGRDTNIISRVEYNYDNVKNVKSIKISSPEGKEMKKIVCNCFEKFSPLFCIEINMNSSEIDTVFYKYNENKMLIFKVVRSSNPFINQKTEYFYDDKNNNKEIKVFDLKNTLIEQYKNTFDLNNRRIEENIWLVKDKIVNRNVFSYDEKGNIINMTSYSANNVISNFWDFSYVYDDKDNWTSMIILKNNKARIVVLRKFEYY